MTSTGSETRGPKRNIFEAVFLSPEEPRLRAGWRLLVQVLIFLVIGLMLSLPVVFLLENPLNPPPEISIGLNFLAAVASIYLARRFIDRRSFASLGLRREAESLKDLLAGIAIGGVVMGFIFGVEWAAGWLRFEGFAWGTDAPGELLPQLGLWGLIFAGVGFYEELFSRGYHLQNMEEGTNTLTAVLLSSLLFGFAHFTNPGATLISSLGITLAGLFLAYPYLRTRQLWLSIGLHVGWNFFEGPVFGFPVSGIKTARLLHHQVDGPPALTGGAFGPEAGLVLLPAMMLGTFLIHAYTQSRRRGAENGK